MFLKKTIKPNGATSIRIVECIRNGKKVLQKTVRTLGQYNTEAEIQLAMAYGDKLIQQINNSINPALPGFEFVNEPKKKKPVIKNESPINHEYMVNINNLKEIKRVNSGIETVYGSIYNQLDFDSLIPDSSKWKDILKAIVLHRVAEPSSKRRSQIFLQRDFDNPIALHNIYRMMDRIDEDRVKNTVRQSTLRLFDKVSLLCFDVTTLYFESFQENELKRPGFSKDNKFKESQIVLALITNEQGHPISYELFAGNTYEGSTLITCITKLSAQWEINKVMLVADRGMFTEKNLLELERLNIPYVVAAKLKSLPKKLKNQILEDTYAPTVVDDELIWHKEYLHNNRRLIVNYSSKRARKDQANRLQLLDRIHKKITDKKIAISKIISNKADRKYLKIINGGEAEVSEKKIQDDARWDGIYGVITNSNDLDISQILSRYRNLWKIEEAFRINKNDLKMRPIFHWTPSRIRAHIAICFLAYTIHCTAIKKIKDRGLNISGLEIRDELLRDQYSVIKEQKTNTLFRIYSNPSEKLIHIYSALGLKRPKTVKPIG